MRTYAPQGRPHSRSDFGSSWITVSPGSTPALLAMLSKKPTITAIVKARQEFLAINMSAGMAPGSDQHQALSKQSVKQLQDALLSLRYIDATDAATVVQTLMTTALVDDDRSEAIRLVNEKVLQGAGGLPQHPASADVMHPKQEIARPEIYLTENDWDVVACPTSTVWSRMECLTHRFCSMGLLYPTEVTTRNICALAFHDQGTRPYIARSTSSILTWWYTLICHKSQTNDQNVSSPCGAHVSLLAVLLLCSRDAWQRPSAHVVGRHAAAPEGAQAEH